MGWSTERGGRAQRDGVEHLEMDLSTERWGGALRDGVEHRERG